MSTTTSKLEFILSMVDKMSGPAKGIMSRLDTLTTRAKVGYEKLGLGIAGTIGAGYGLAEMVNPAREMNRALGDTKSLGVADDVLQQLRITSRQFALDFGESATSFVSSAYDIQSAIAGLQGNELSAFTTASALMAKATKADAAETSSFLGQMYNVFQTTADKMGKAQWVEQFAAQSAYAVNVFRADGKDFADAFKNFGTTGLNMGMSMAEQFAALGQLKNVMEGGEAGTRLRSFLDNLSKGADKLGITIKGKSGDMLALPDILTKIQGKLNGLGKVDAADKLRDAFVSPEAISAITTLMGNIDMLRTNIDALGKQQGLEALATMAKARTDKLDRVAQGWWLLREAMGQQMFNAMNPTLDKIIEIEATLNRWTELFPNITRAIGKGIIGLFALIAALSILSIAVGLSKFLMVGWSAGAGIMASSLNTLLRLMKGMQAASAVTSANLAAGLGPMAALRKGISAFGWVAGGVFDVIAGMASGVLGVFAGLTAPVLALIVAIAAGALLIYRYWQPIKAFFVGVFDGLSQAIGPAFASIMEALGPLAPVFSAIGAWVGDLFGTLGEAASQVMGWLSGILEPVQFTSQELARATSIGQRFGQALAAPFKLLAAVLGWIGSGVSWLVGQFPTIQAWWVGFVGWLSGLAPFQALGAGVDWLLEQFASLQAWWQGFTGWLSGLNPFAGWGAAIDGLIGKVAGLFGSLGGLSIPVPSMPAMPSMPAPSAGLAAPKASTPAGGLVQQFTRSQTNNSGRSIGAVHVHNYGQPMSGQRLAAELAMAAP